MNEQYYENPEFNTSTVSPGSVLTFGILSLVLPLPLVGLIFAIMARKKAKKFGEETGTTCGQVNVGKVLGTIGLVLNIISLVSGVVTVGLYALEILMLIGMSAASSTYCIMPFLF